jgi:tetratricopeptide (TPR) repeat protein
MTAALMATPALAQVGSRSGETQLLREAAALESRGDLDGAAAALLELLDRHPASSGGLFALERVLRSKGTIDDLLPVVGAFLEAAPDASGVRALELRVLLEVGDTDALREHGRAWIERDATSEVPYREVARVYERAFGPDVALGLLQDGRYRLGPPAFALEIGDLLAQAGDTQGAAQEWGLAVREDERQLSTVVRRVRGVDRAGEAAEGVVALLRESPRPEARRSAALVAAEFGHADDALDLARGVVGSLDDAARTDFLAEIARVAGSRDLPTLAAWAYDELGDEADTPGERRQFDQRIVDLSLAQGDTLAALVAQRRIAESFTSGSVDRRRASAQVIRLERARAEPEALRAMLETFREDFPNAPELDDLAAGIARSLQARGDPEAAAAVLDGVAGPRSSLERGYLLLAVGEVVQGRAALLIALTGLAPSEATPVIQFAGLLGRVSDVAAEELARQGVRAHRGEGAEAAQDLAAALSDFEADERAAVLAEAARMAERAGAEPTAAELRVRLLVEYGTAPEAGEASLALARFRASTPDGVEEAIRILEDLIASRPNAAVVPDARMELQRLRERRGA